MIRERMDDAGRAAFDRCVRECFARAWRLAWCVLHHADDAEDALQQSLAIALVKSDDIPADDPWPWFSTIVRLEAYNIRRKRDRRSRLLSGIVRATGASPELLHRNRSRESPPGEAARAEAIDTLRREMSRLPPTEREAVCLTSLGGLSHVEAAAELGIPLGTLKGRVRKGRERLQRRLASASALALPALLADLSIPGPAGGFRRALDRWLRGASERVTNAARVAGRRPSGRRVGVALVAAVLLTTVSFAYTGRSHEPASDDPVDEGPVASAPDAGEAFASPGESGVVDGDGEGEGEGATPEPHRNPRDIEDVVVPPEDLKAYLSAPGKGRLLTRVAIHALLFALLFMMFSRAQDRRGLRFERVFRIRSG